MQKTYISFPGRRIVSLTHAPQESINQNPAGKDVRVDRDFRFPPVYFIGIMRFSLHQDDGRFLYRYSLTEDATGEKMTDDLHYIFFEIPKCGCNQDASPLEKAGYALNNMESLSGRPDGFDGELLDLLFNSAEISNFTAEEKIKYENDMTTERDIQNQIDFAHDKGIAEGIEKGIEQGIEKGIEKGVAQRNAEIARAMLSDGVAPDLIAKYSGLSAEEIDSLR